jgi:hypothetical protein
VLPRSGIAAVRSPSAVRSLAAVTAVAMLVLPACAPVTDALRFAPAAARQTDDPVQRPPLPLRPDGYGVAQPTP